MIILYKGDAGNRNCKIDNHENKSKNDSRDRCSAKIEIQGNFLGWERDQLQKLFIYKIASYYKANDGDGLLRQG